MTSALPPPEIRLGPGDRISIKFPYRPELNEDVLIRPDGKIALQIVDTVQAAGLTPEELDAELTSRYAREITNPSLAVIVRELAAQRVFVGGEVTHPGVIAMTRPLSVFDAVVSAGGPAQKSAKVSNVVVIRHIGEQRHATVVDLEPAMNGKPHAPFMLAPNDVVYVSRTRISRVNQWVEQHINDLLPSTFFQLSQRRGNTTIGYAR